MLSTLKDGALGCNIILHKENGIIFRDEIIAITLKDGRYVTLGSKILLDGKQGIVGEIRNAFDEIRATDIFGIVFPDKWKQKKMIYITPEQLILETPVPVTN